MAPLPKLCSENHSVCDVVREGKRKLESEMSLLPIICFPDEKIWTQSYGRANIFIKFFN